VALIPAKPAAIPHHHVVTSVVPVQHRRAAATSSRVAAVSTTVIAGKFTATAKAYPGPQIGCGRPQDLPTFSDAPPPGYGCPDADSCASRWGSTNATGVS
jgi:hypothetical protein